MTNEGGMYHILKHIIYLVLKSETKSFTSSQLKELCGLCSQSITNNISRLVKAGFLTREKYTLPNRRGQFYRYKIREVEIIDFIKNNLY